MWLGTHRCGSGPTLLWLWCRPAVSAPIQPLTWELPYAASAAIKSKNKQKEERNVGLKTKNIREVGRGLGLSEFMEEKRKKKGQQS